MHMGDLEETNIEIDQGQTSRISPLFEACRQGVGSKS